jgi:hypothetical protein
MDSNDKRIRDLYNAWHEAELRALHVFDEVNEDYEHPRYIEANSQAHAILMELLKPSSSLYGALAKLKIASHCEGYLKDVEDPECTVIAPRAVISAIQDLENIINDPFAKCLR